MTEHHVVLPELQRLRKAIIEFRDRHYGSLSIEAVEAIERFGSSLPLVEGSQQNVAWIKKGVAALVLVRSAIDLHLADFSAMARRTTERALIHLQRSIVVDPEMKRRWMDAFKHQREEACEGLGAVHLLMHGIWAFKVNAKGERTDLVLVEPIKDTSQVERTAEALVLTEWKKVKVPRDLESRADEARRQASRYSVGALGGIELASYSYIVLVSERRHAVEHLDRDENGRHYIHFNIAVDPQTPSNE